MKKKGVIVESQVVWWGIAIAVLILVSVGYFLYKDSISNFMQMIFDKIRYG